MSAPDLERLLGELHNDPLAVGDLLRIPRAHIRTATREIIAITVTSREGRGPGGAGERYASRYITVLAIRSGQATIESWTASRWVLADGSIVWRLIGPGDFVADASHMDVIEDAWIERWREENVAGVRFEGWDRVEPRHLRLVS